MTRLSPCPRCGGQGLLAFERGPALEPCRECAGAGRVYGDPSYRGLFAELLRERGADVSPDLRLLLLGLRALDERLAALEAERRGG